MIENPKHINWSIGQKCYFFESWTSQIQDGIIANITHQSDNVTVASVKGITLPGSTNRLIEHLFDTEASAQEALADYKKAKAQRLADKINSIEDLVSFAYGYCVAPCEEYTDWTAREVYAAKAKELLGIELVE